MKLSHALLISLLLIGAGCSKDAATDASVGVTPKGASKAPAKSATSEPEALAKKAAPQPKTGLKELTPEGLKALVLKRGAKLTMVPVWATWCVPCIKEMPHLASFYKAHQKDGLQMLGVCVGDLSDGDEREQIEEVVDDLESPFPHYVVNPDNAEAFFTAFGERYGGTLPATVWLDGKGVPLGFTRNGWTDESLRKIIVPLLK